MLVQSLAGYAACTLPGVRRSIPLNLAGSMRTSTTETARTAEEYKASIAAFIEYRAGQAQKI